MINTELCLLTTVDYILYGKPSKFFNELLKGMVPGIHLNNPNSCNDLIHDTHTFVSYFCSFQPVWNHDKGIHNKINIGITKMGYIVAAKVEKEDI